MPSGSILLVDDEESVLITMQAILEMDGYHVSTAQKGALAIEQLRKQSFDLVMTDLRLDDTDGLTVLAEVHATSPDTVAIMLTGYASLESSVQALREGAYDYLVKPCDVDELKATVARGMERRQLGMQLRDRVCELEVANDRVCELEVANETIQSLNLDLQRRVDEATKSLTLRLAELARARDEIAVLFHESQERVERLKELDRLKSQFLSMASHELKTPLTSISGFLQIVARRMRRRLDRGFPSQAEWEQEARVTLEQVDVINRQTSKLARLVDELLDVSRIQSGRVEFKFTEFDLAELASEVASRMQLTTTDHVLKVSAPEQQTPIVADRDHLEQVLNNLLSNAIKYSPDGGPIELSLRENADELLLSVCDRGIGILPSELDSVFDLFYRSPDHGGRKTGGLGLGLYISKEIVGRHGGRILVESVPEAGSTFSVVLPRIAAPPDTAAGG
jgi:signal transduction histidine kinase